MPSRTRGRARARPDPMSISSHVERRWGDEGPFDRESAGEARPIRASYAGRIDTMDQRRSRPTAALVTIWLATLLLVPAASAQSTNAQSTNERDRGAAVTAFPLAPALVEQGYVHANGIAYHYQV